MCKVYCIVDAIHSSIEIGDLLTTSSMRGYAMKAENPIMAFEAVIGKEQGIKSLKDCLYSILIFKANVERRGNPYRGAFYPAGYYDAM